MINIELMQLNIACISEDAGIKVYKSYGSPAKFKPTTLTQWCFPDGKTSILCTRKCDSHFFLNKSLYSVVLVYVLHWKALWPGAFFYIPPPLGITFAPPILQSPWFTGDPTQRGS